MGWDFYFLLPCLRVHCPVFLLLCFLLTFSFILFFLSFIFLLCLGGVKIWVEGGVDGGWRGFSKM